FRYLICDPWRTSSPLRSDLGFRYTQVTQSRKVTPERPLYLLSRVCSAVGCAVDGDTRGVVLGLVVFVCTAAFSKFASSKIVDCRHRAFLRLPVLGWPGLNCVDSELTRLLH